MIIIIRGINKQVIEINDTQNEFFEKVILFVRPNYNEEKQKKIKNEAEKLIKSYCEPKYTFKKTLWYVTAGKFVSIGICGALLAVLIMKLAGS